MPERNLDQVREFARPRVATARVEIPVEVLPTPWTDRLDDDLVDVESVAPPPICVKALSIRLTAPPVRTVGFQFPDSPWHGVAAEKAPRGRRRDKSSAPPSRTRFKPPDDVIKLEDRLFYVLQPPLENIVATNAVRFPFEPFPYQYAGVAFLYPRYTAILADEMGLGKTMQAATTIRLLLMARELRRILLVCPKPLVTNWKRELGLWAPEIPVTIIEGDQQKRSYQWSQEKTPIVIANYELLMRDRDIVNDEQQHFDLVVLDEAQRIKNRSSTTSQVVCAIPRTRSWALTGTPVENTPDDLVGIFEFLSPGYLSAGMQARRMGKMVQDHILRRTKEMVLTDMPPKMFRDADIQLTPEQWETYRIAEDEGVVRLSEMGDELTIQHVFQLVLRLKQICNFDPVTGASSKLERLEADLEEVAASGQKAIVFSQWVQSLERLRGALARFRPHEYHGKVPGKRRDAIIEEFRNDPRSHVILMSYGAGSVGLNLQFSEYVFLFDRWWNPAVEDQAINRAHRIGVAGPVTVTRMMSLDTIEERIHQVLEEKRELFEMILSHTGDPRKTGLTQDDIFGLFKLQTPKSKAAA
ncbi:MAG: DEAD/DEAH box helicase [Pirellulaceae bacterium]|nr:DEAD/DEAH box helicase [Pirellulaceae bacterium]MDP7020449.1 DEAD/DEAH box helicase [Pirellulaceae bacterium]